MKLIRVGGEQAEFLEIAVLGRCHPECTDYWDGNWLRVRVRLAAGGFHGVVQADLRADELVEFHRQLAALCHRLTGTARFRTLEEWLSIDVSGDGLGHMSLQCEVRDAPGVGNVLRFCLATDQTFVRPMLDELGEVLAEFPVRGR